MSPGDLDLPFEENPPGQSAMLGDLLGDGQIACGAVIVAATLPVPDMGVMPCLIYRFAKPDGSGFYPAVALVVDERQLVDLKLLTAQAANSAIKAARAAS